MTDRALVEVQTVDAFWSATEGGHIKIACTGNFTAVSQAAREICEAIIRGNARWWIQSATGILTDDADRVDQMAWTIEARYGD